jgi:hypothetical protein
MYIYLNVKLLVDMLIHLNHIIKCLIIIKVKIERNNRLLILKFK